MNLNLFDWIREGVKRSVLMGISDAAEHIADKDEFEGLQKRLQSTVDESRLITEAKPKSTRGKRKGLGRTLAIEDAA